MKINLITLILCLTSGTAAFGMAGMRWTPEVSQHYLQAVRVERPEGELTFDIIRKGTKVVGLIIDKPSQWSLQENEPGNVLMNGDKIVAQAGGRKFFEYTIDKGTPTAIKVILQGRQGRVEAIR